MNNPYYTGGFSWFQLVPRRRAGLGCSHAYKALNDCQEKRLTVIECLIFDEQNTQLHSLS